MTQAFRHAVRSLRRSPWYSCAVVLSLALGLGANTAAFSIARGLLWPSLPFTDESRLVAIGSNLGISGGARVQRGPNSATDWDNDERDFQSWQKGARSLRDLATYSAYPAVVGQTSHSELVEGGLASPSLLRVLGARPLRGRWFDSSETRAKVVVLSSQLSQRYFASDSLAIGKALRVNGELTTIIGVLRPDGGLPLKAEFWLPSNNQGQIVARLRESARIAVARDELESLSPRVLALRRSNYSVRIVVTPLRDHLFGAARPAVSLLTGAAGLLLLIACANVASLSMARSLERRREIAVRAALGASRRALAALVLAENLLLACAGVCIGVVIAIWAARAFNAAGPPDLLRTTAISVDQADVAFATFVALACALLVSVAPTLSMSARGIGAALAQGGAQAGRGVSTSRVRRWLVISQMALALTLMIGASLLIQNLQRLSRVQLGFSPSNVVIATISFIGDRYRDEGTRRLFVREIVFAAGKLPGVQSVGVGPAPLVGGRATGVREGFNVVFSFRDTTRTTSSRPTIWAKFVDPGYLETFKVRVVSGRGIRHSDDSASEHVALLNRTAARAFFPAGGAVGHLLPIPPGFGLGTSIRVVGTVDDMLQRDLTISANPEVLLPSAQQSWRSPFVTISVRGSAPPAALIRGLRQAVHNLDPEMATTRLEPMDAVVAESLAPHTFLLLLLSVLATLALTLSTVGVYAVVSYFATQRTREIGVRLALGAKPRHVFKLVLGEGMRLAGAGIAIGLPGALLFNRLLAVFLYNVELGDFVAYVAAPIALAATVLLAAYVPALQSSKLDPAVILRAE